MNLFPAVFILLFTVTVIGVPAYLAVIPMRVFNKAFQVNHLPSGMHSVAGFGVGTSEGNFYKNTALEYKEAVGKAEIMGELPDMYLYVGVHNTKTKLQIPFSAISHIQRKQGFNGVYSLRIKFNNKKIAACTLYLKRRADGALPSVDGISTVA